MSRRLFPPRSLFGALRSLPLVLLPAFVMMLLLGLVLALSCCRPPLGPPPDSPPVLDEERLQRAQDAARVELDRAYGTRLRARAHAVLGTVAFALAETGAVQLPPVTSVSSALVQWVLRYRVLYGVTAADDLDPEGIEVDERGLRHVRLRQEHRGVPVWGSVLVGHLDGRGALLAISARLVPLAAWPVAESMPTLQSEEARWLALGLVRAELPVANAAADPPSLWYLPAGRRLALAYRIEVSGQLGALPLRVALFLDAHDGQLLLREDRVAALDVTVPATGSGTGALGEARALAISQRGDTYSLEDPTRGGQRTTMVKPGERLPGRTVTSKQPASWDGAGQALDVHAHLATLWDYFARVHRRYGWDGRGHGLVAARLQSNDALALFDGERLLFGDGDGSTFLPLGSALDVVAHEYGHAILRSAADLAGSGESGALDEGFADLWACLIEQASAPQGSGSAPGGWTVGERIYRPATGPSALRDLADPRRTAQARTLDEIQPDVKPPLGSLAALSGLGQTVQRRNAGLPGHVGYLMAQRLGPEKTAAILYRAASFYLHRYAGFSDAADGFFAAARDLYGPASAEAKAVQDSWAAVGVHGLPQ